MLPSRGIARSVRHPITQRHALNRLVGPSRRGGNGRQYSVISPRSTSSRCVTNAPLRPRLAASPLALGGLASSRTLSSWGWGLGWGSSNNKDSASSPPPSPASPPPAAEEPTTTTTTTTTKTAELESTIPPAETTAPSPETLSSSAGAAEPTVPTTEIDLSSILNAEDILKMPEDLGYLHAIGLDYGWGFTASMQWLLEHVHVYSGWGWGASIVATALLLRAVMFYPQVQSLRFNALMQKMRRDPRSQEALKLVQKGFQDRDMEMRQKGQVLNKLVREEYGASNWGVAWGLMQIPFTFGLFRTVTGMTHVPVPALEGAGYLWFTDLTATDPYFVLPAAGTALMMSALIVNSKYTPASQKKMLKPMMYIFGVVGFVGTTFLSSAVNLMTVSLGASTLVTALILDIPSVRRALGLPLSAEGSSPSPSPSPTPIPKTSYEAPRVAAASAASPAGIAGMREQLTTSLNDMKKGISDSVSNYTGTYQGTDAERAERKRKDMLRKLEDMRRQQERDEFERKYKGRK